MTKYGKMQLRRADVKLSMARVGFSQGMKGLAQLLNNVDWEDDKMDIVLEVEKFVDLMNDMLGSFKEEIEDFEQTNTYVEKYQSGEDEDEKVPF